MSIPQVDAYIFFDGNCSEAMRFYQQTLGGSIDMMMKWSESSEGGCPPGSGERIMHASLNLNGRTSWLRTRPRACMKSPRASRCR